MALLGLLLLLFQPLVTWIVQQLYIKCNSLRLRRVSDS